MLYLGIGDGGRVHFVGSLFVVYAFLLCGWILGSSGMSLLCEDIVNVNSSLLPPLPRLYVGTFRVGLSPL
jgi:hypothetical protein